MTAPAKQAAATSAASPPTIAWANARASRPPTFERVPPRTYGGTELIVGLVTDELVRRGHDVTLFASGDSRTAARLRSVTPEPIRYGSRTDDDLTHAEYLQLANAQACFLAAA